MDNDLLTHWRKHYDAPSADMTDARFWELPKCVH